MSVLTPNFPKKVGHYGGKKQVEIFGHEQIPPQKSDAVMKDLIMALRRQLLTNILYILSL